MRVEVPTEHSLDYQVACGRKGCVVFYKGDHCLFCLPADEILRDTLKQFGVSESIIHEVDISIDDNVAMHEGIVALPTIEICSECLVGIPQEGAIRDAVVKALMRECFCDQ